MENITIYYTLKNKFSYKNLNILYEERRYSFTRHKSIQYTKNR